MKTNDALTAYANLVQPSRRRGRLEFEHELIDTGDV